MMRASRLGLAIGLLWACAPEEDGNRQTESPAAPVLVPPTGVTDEGSGEQDAQRAPPDDAQGPDGSDPPPAQPADGVEESAPERCLPAPGTTGSPTTLSELMALIDGLPKPTTVACLLQSLDRPLELYLTSSVFSAQPAPAERSPRTFVVLGPLLLSVVAEGEASTLVEVGYRSAPGRSIKAEIPFPLQGAPTPARLLEQVRTGRVSMCAGCHTNEQTVSEPFFDGGGGAFESDVIPPLYVFQVPVDTLRAEAQACDAASEPDRCGLLSALFDHGEVRQSPIWSEQP